MKKQLLLTVSVLSIGLLVYLGLLYPFAMLEARTPVGETQSMILANGNRMTWHVSGTGPRITLVASLGREASDFNELVLSLNKAGYRTLAVEAPGIGGSELIEKPISLYRLADDVAQIVHHDIAETGNAETVLLIGHAFGNRVMRATASKYPDIAKGVVLIAAGGQREVEPKAKQALRNSITPYLTASQREEAIRYAFFAEDNEVPDYWLRGWYLQTALLQVSAVEHTADKLWQQAGGLPMMILQAERDTIAPIKDAADLLKVKLGDQLSVEIIENTGHALLPEAPTDIARAVLIFAKGLQ
ncbi:alpha/beta fold hydrolase [Shewanella pealeana]|uniref:Putative hydrolase n=1 Tax=Shewanella pealeana (strain ATCC 700345 / ANG-SQ1) TaxID=398579 RepID=A8H6H2_SHEPA|nr:alpha/beta hydrolase [Shewanella pealeana]ABV88159.1 putative hydrolase [Shewanella pealeana ATCC 700345]